MLVVVVLLPLSSSMYDGGELDHGGGGGGGGGLGAEAAAVAATVATVEAVVAVDDNWRQK
jgi:hypothetical protein